ncbi:MAG: ATP-binding cassette domain-containing protein [Actinobacteria bacterium]|nr:ATP-binding cassette domain-containing protein [Actinomycetota bacterium]
MTETRNSAALQVRGLSKSYGAVRALIDVSFELSAGSVLGLIGDNGAGKTTLVKCVSGVLAPDGGEILVDGQEIVHGDPEAARNAGIETVYQDLMLVPPLDVATNLFLGRELISGKPLLRSIGWLNKRPMYEEAASILQQLKIHIPSITEPVENLSGGQRQSVAVGRAAAWGRHIVLMDEPVAALGVQQSAVVLELVRTLASQGVAVVIISHNMQQVLDVCDEVLVMRHGENVGKFPIHGVDASYLISLMTGATSYHVA